MISSWNNLILNSNAQFIDEISVKELEHKNLSTLPFDPVLLDILKTSRLVSQFQVVDGKNPESVQRAVEGQHVGTIIHAD